MYPIQPHHRGIYIQKERGIGGIFSSLFRTLIPIGKSVLKKVPSIIKSANKSTLGKQLKKSAKKIALDAAANLIETGDINQTINKTVEQSKNEIANTLKNIQNPKKRKIHKSRNYNTKIQKYHLLK